MKSRGFTLLEMLVTIAILGVIISLLWKAYFETERMRDSAETRSDQILAVISAAETLTHAFKSMESVPGTTLTERTAEFAGYLRGEPGRLVIESRNDDEYTTLIKFMKGNRVSFQETVQVAVNFKYWDGGNWVKMWQNRELPSAVIFEIIPRPDRSVSTEPYRLGVNIPGGMRLDTGESSEETETVEKEADNVQAA